MINVFQHTNRYRMRKPEDIVSDFMMLYEQGVRTFKIVDELFLLNRKHVTQICERLSALEFGRRGVSIWCYGRPDTVDPDYLKLIRSAGIDWIALGIESGAESIRDGADKSMSQDDIADVVTQIEKAGINVIANYIFGLPGETQETMQQTMNLAWHLNTAFANFYTAMAYPGSKLYDEAIDKGWRLPETWAGYSQHNEHTRPLAPGDLSAREILAFRDEAFGRYFSSDRYVSNAVQRFGQEAADQIRKMTSYKLKRNLLEGAKQ